VWPILAELLLSALEQCWEVAAKHPARHFLGGSQLQVGGVCGSEYLLIQFGARTSSEAQCTPLFLLVGRGGEGKEWDGTTVFVFRVVCVLLVVCGCHVLPLLPSGLGGEKRRRLYRLRPQDGGKFYVLKFRVHYMVASPAAMIPG
jgi:hypothetical protein